MKIGIDSIAFSTSRYFLKLETLALHRRVDYAKYYIGIGQTRMSVFPPNEDIVTIAIDAAQKAISNIEDKNDIDMLIFATESAFDLSKSAGIYVHNFLGLKEDCRVFDLKQACYSATAALQLAKSYVSDNPNSKVLIIGSDIVKYSPNTSGESTQGGAAVAFVMSKNPRILEIEPYSGVHTIDVMDFWRPVYTNEALFDGKISAYNYLKSLEISFARYLKRSNISEAEIYCTCFHTPFCRIARKANCQIFKDKSIEDTLVYNSIIGNSCSASLFISFISLMDNANENLSKKRIGFYSYGSGSVAEYFSGIVSENYRTMLFSESNEHMLTDRIEVSFEEYERFCKNTSTHPYKYYKNIGNVSLTGVNNHKRIYNIISE